MRRVFLTAALAVLALEAGAQPTPGTDRVELFIWSRGDDANDGSRSAPMKTLSAALARVRGNGKPTVIRMAGGVYPIDKPIELVGKDSRTAEAPLTITAHSRKKPVVLSAGVDIPSDSWRAAGSGDRLTELLPARSRPRVLVAELAGTALAEEFAYRPDPDKKEQPPLITWAGYRLPRSRWPNRGYAYLDKVLERGPSTRRLKATEKPAAYSFDQPTGGSFTVKDSLDFGRLAAEFAATGDMRVEGYLHNDWFFQQEMLGRVDVGRGALQLVRYTRYGIESKKIKLPRRFRLTNTISYLDQPGEWFFDHGEKKLYLWPVRKPTADEPIRMARGHEILKARGVDHVVLRGLTFEGFGPAGVSFQQANHVTIAGCEFRAAAGVGVRVQEGTHNTITGCDLHDLGGGLVLTGVPGNRRDLIPEHNRATNNHLWDLAARHYGGAAAVRGVGVHFAHNVLHGMQTGLTFSGCNDLIAEYNEFYDLGYEMGDWNAAYAYSDLSLQNNVFRHNFFHHLMETPGAHPIAAIRADDGGSGLRVHGNVFFKTGRAAVQFSGPNCAVTNNFLVGIPFLLWTVQRPYDKGQAKPAFMKEQFEKMQRIGREIARGERKANDKDNLIGRAEQVFGEAGWKNNRVWIDKYPNFADHFDFEDFNRSPWGQSYALVKHNYADEAAKPFPFHFHGKNPSSSPGDAKKFLPETAEFWAPNKLDPDRVFRRAGQLDFSFRSRRLAKGVEKFDFDKVGLVADKHRPRPPNKADYRREVISRYRGVKSHGGELDLKSINRRYGQPDYLGLAE